MNIKDRPPPETDRVIEQEHNYGAIRDAAGGIEDGVSPQEAYDDMVWSLKKHARNLERQKAALREALETLLESSSKTATAVNEAQHQARATLAATKPTP